MLKGSSRSRHTKTGQERTGAKSFGITNQNLKSLGQIEGSTCDEELVKELQIQYHTNYSAWKMLCYGVGGFCQLQSQGFAPSKGQIESDWLSQHTAVSRDPTGNAAYRSMICTHARL